MAPLWVSQGSFCTPKPLLDTNPRRFQMAAKPAMQRRPRLLVEHPEIDQESRREDDIADERLKVGAEGRLQRRRVTGLFSRLVWRFQGSFAAPFAAASARARQGGLGAACSSAPPGRNAMCDPEGFRV